MSKHTPGPWTIDCDDIGYSVCADDVLICDMPPFSYDLDERLPNANLIAAAPDLLNAVRFLLSNPDNRISSADINAARAAIAKAEGK